MATEKQEEAAKRKASFKLDLDLKIIKGLSLSRIPTGYDKNGELQFGPNPPVDKKGNRHDLRRSFGTMMTALEVPETIKRSFFNHTAPNVTAVYTAAEWDLLRSWMTRIEQAIIATAPNVYNSLKPLDWPPLPAPDPHVCIPAKPRTGRPKKEAQAEG